MSTSDFDPFGTDSSENWRPSHRIKLEGVPDLRKGERFSPFGKIQTTTASNQATGRPVLSIRGPLRSEQREVATLLEDAKLWIQRFMSLSPAQADVIAIFAVYTYTADAFDCAPYLQITSAEKRCGKTRLLELLDFSVNKPLFTSRTSTAALVRSLHEDHPTLLLDESDAAFGADKSYSETLRGILNAGYRRSGNVSLCVGKGSSDQKVTRFEVFGPKVIAGIGKLPSTIADRSIPIKLERRRSHEKVERFRHRIARTQIAPLQQRLREWGNPAVVKELSGAEPTLPDSLSDRQQDVAEPLLAIADYAGNEWGQRARNALIELFGQDVAADDSLGVQLLRDIKTLLGHADRISSKELCKELNEKEASPWPRFHDGNGVFPGDVARILGRYQITPRTIRKGEESMKGYLRESFEDAWSRYL